MLGTAAAVAVLSVLLGACGGGDSTPAAAPTPTSSDTYGGYPSFLPPDTVDGGFGHQVVDASAQHPTLATQGDTVRVHIGTTAVLATVTGPAVPVAGQQYQAENSPATWTVTLKNPTHALPVDPSTFQAVDEEGSIYDLTPQGTVPRVLKPGRTARFRLFTRISTGEGRMRWIPRGHLAPVEWDFVVETD